MRSGVHLAGGIVRPYAALTPRLRARRRLDPLEGGAASGRQAAVAPSRFRVGYEPDLDRRRRRAKRAQGLVGGRGDALPVGVAHGVVGDGADGGGAHPPDYRWGPDRIRTCDLRFRSFRRECVGVRPGPLARAFCGYECV
jgi:hypothetical protein